ncbi:Alpha-(1,3)-fucosyltransferase B [Gryllus bimaculatus]|nr:Alpha-(1,3)-fucosyltransferase B [Gryllus bimaculatus]
MKHLMRWKIATSLLGLTVFFFAVIAALQTFLEMSTFLSLFGGHLSLALMFYGSKFDVLDLPLPRNASSFSWALFHEESPKNNPILSHESALNLFNFTATFSRWSSFPLTLQYLQNLDMLTSHKYLLSLKEKNTLLHKIAPVLYIHSDCNTPLERDAYVVELMKYIAVDSYGLCLNNRKLPPSLTDPLESLESEEFFHFVARYKFTLAFENSICDDYITEKLWRPLIVGSIPIYLGSPSVCDWLPNAKSAILVSDYQSPKSLAEFLLAVNDNNSLYNSFLDHKLKDIDERISNVKLMTVLSERKWGVGDDFEGGNMVEHFECFVCQMVARRNSDEVFNGKFIANISHYNCPLPLSPITLKRNESNWWIDQWKLGHCEAEVLKQLMDENRIMYTKEEFYSVVKKLMYQNKC